LEQLTVVVGLFGSLNVILPGPSNDQVPAPKPPTAKAVKSFKQ
jgi:hypothetical protein